MRVLVLYTGRETKIFLNQGRYHFKQSQIERKLNIILFVNIIVLFTLDGIMTGRYLNFLLQKGSTLNYIFPDGNPNASSYAGADVGSFFLLLNSLIPLALVVELELIKLFFTMVV